MKSSIRIKRAFCIAALMGSQLLYAQPSAAQSTSPPYQTVRIQVYVFDASNGTAVPGETVYYEESGGQYCKGVRPLGSQYIGAGATGGDGVADFTVEACPGEAMLWINGGSLFDTRRVAIVITPGQRSYEARVGLTQKNRTRQPSDKYNNQTERTLHIQVRGRLANGTLVPVHFAGVYDRNGRHILTTDYDGNATARVLDVMGEMVTLHADGSHWREGTASFIVGASEGVRITRNDDYVRIVLNGEGDNLSEEATLNFVVHGKTAKSWTAVHFATIYDAEGHHLTTTDYNGHGTARVKTKLGEPYTVKVDGGSRWKSATKEILIGAAAGIGTTVAYNNVDFLLDPAQAAKELTVEVLNHETDKPVAAASVTIYKPDHFPGTAVAHATTDAHGLAKFDAEEVGSALLNGEARVGATHGGSKSEIQTLASSLLQGEAPKYVLYMKEKQETTKWSGTWYNGPYTMQISGGNGSLGYQFLRSDGVGGCCPLIDQGGGSCTVHGNVATCTENAHYHDSAKDVQRSSDVKMTLTGETISAMAKVKTASITLSSGQPCPDIAQCTGMHPGAEFDGVWTRKKP
ncbi:MAG TPA: hypothetical protein VFW34_11610 [Candidatus Rubrimentiphilum sp.]|nr:hypothetical protein [Candidatus Rubrimentiphilum sp.]